MKERKLVLKKVEEVSLIQQMLQTVIQLLKTEFPNMEVEFSQCLHACYIDTYYDTDQQILRKNGESFKTRAGSDLGGQVVNKAIMRRQTKYPEKQAFAPWDEVEIPLSKLSFETAKKVMRPFFYEFDFEELNSDPVLICTTHRTAFKITMLQGEDEKNFSIYFDNIKYSKGFNIGEDNIIKLNTRYYIPKILDIVLKGLEENYQQYEMLYMSRYERALEVLKS